IVTDPASVVEETRQYFTGLYKCSVAPNKPKPWLKTPLVLTVKSCILNDPFLWPIAATLADLHNYSVINASFPGDIKDTHLTYFHKCGICTDLSNWRGLLISNFLANSPMTWLNFKLSPYAAQMGIILETQVATQPGVQTHDLMSFLGGLKTWSYCTKTPLYLLKQD
ncbi:hypothetical protein L208DRAFT_1282705, partial [Tricholoma matsutake]